MHAAVAIRGARAAVRRADQELAQAVFHQPDGQTPERIVSEVFVPREYTQAPQRPLDDVPGGAPVHRTPVPGAALPGVGVRPDDLLSAVLADEVDEQPLANGGVAVIGRLEDAVVGLVSQLLHLSNPRLEVFAAARFVGHLVGLVTGSLHAHAPGLLGLLSATSQTVRQLRRLGAQRPDDLALIAPCRMSLLDHRAPLEEFPNIFHDYGFRVQMLHPVGNRVGVAAILFVDTGSAASDREERALWRRPQQAAIGTDRERRGGVQHEQVLLQVPVLWMIRLVNTDRSRRVVDERPAYLAIQNVHGVQQSACRTPRPTEKIHQIVLSLIEIR